MGGRDRTGLVTMLLLGLVGVDPEDIAADYLLTAEVFDDFMATQGTSARELIHGTLRELDVERYLRAGGLTDADDLAALRDRVLS